jgi:predicted TIM-barrel fold metal-dependent hydrolase
MATVGAPGNAAETQDAADQEPTWQQRWLISADSHVVEPAELWIHELPERFKDQGPRGFRNPQNHHWMFGGPGFPSSTDLTMSSSPGKTNAEIDRVAIGQSEPPATGDARNRLADLWRDGVVADVIYSTCAFELFHAPDLDLQQHCFSIFNDWIADYCHADPDRLVGVGMIPTEDVTAAVTELRRCHEAGLRAAMLGCRPRADGSLGDPEYEPFWALAEELDMIVSLHILTGKLAFVGSDMSLADRLYYTTALQEELKHSICEVIAAGVFDRHPGLKLVGAEGGIDYVAPLFRGLDSMYAMFGGPLCRPPSEYIGVNLFMTFISDPVGLNNVRLTGPRGMMWSSDYPHRMSTWPHSRSVVHEEFTNALVSESDTRALTVDNAIELYGFDRSTVFTPSPLIRDGITGHDDRSAWPTV